MLKQSRVVEIIVPRYAELRVDKLWPLVNEIENLAFYFPEYSHKTTARQKVYVLDSCNFSLKRT